MAPVATTAVTPKEQALMLPAEPENPRWILTALEALREHELRHTVQASMWGPLFLGLPLGVFGDAVWDLRGGSGKFETSPFEPVARGAGGDRGAAAARRASAHHTRPGSSGSASARWWSSSSTARPGGP